MTDSCSAGFFLSASGVGGVAGFGADGAVPSSALCSGASPAATNAAEGGSPAGVGTVCSSVSFMRFPELRRLAAGSASLSDLSNNLTVSDRRNDHDGLGQRKIIGDRQIDLGLMAGRRDFLKPP